MTNDWIVRTAPNPEAKLRLFCFHYAGGGASIFYHWPRYLPPEVEVCSVLLPGREVRLKESPYTRLEPLVTTIAATLQSYLDRPFAFFGHSMGALVSFEVARHLRRHYHQLPSHLSISAHRAPQLCHPDPTTHTLSDEALLQRLITLEGTPKEAIEHLELMRLMLPTIRADFAVCETYAYLPERPLDCPISLFAGIQDPTVPVEDVQAWREQTTNTCRLRLIPGNHFFLHSAQTLLLEILSYDLTQLLERSAWLG